MILVFNWIALTQYFSDKYPCTRGFSHFFKRVFLHYMYFVLAKLITSIMRVKVSLIMLFPVVETQHDDTYVLTDAMKITSLFKN